MTITRRIPAESHVHTDLPHDTIGAMTESSSPPRSRADRWAAARLQSSAALEDTDLLDDSALEDGELELAEPRFDDSARSDDSSGFDGDQLDLAERQALRRVAGLSTELADVTEVEYRQLRLERVVLVGVWTERHRGRRRELAGRAGRARRDRRLRGARRR